MLFLYYAFLACFLLVSVTLCFLILMQESKSMGLGASFGVDSGDSLFGVSTPDILKKITAWLSFIFVGGCVILSVWTGSIAKKEGPGSASLLEKAVEKVDD